MKILFVYSLEDVYGLTKPLRSWTAIQFGISYISSILKDHGHLTRLIVLGNCNSWQDNTNLLDAYIGEFDPHLVCFTSVASQYPFIRKIASWIKEKWPEKPLVIGGPHASLNPSDVIIDHFDVVCLGEGEYPMLELCQQLEAGTSPHGIANLWIKSRDGGIERNPPRPFVLDLDQFPFPDRSLWISWMAEHHNSELSVLVGRGCPYECTYCCNHALKKVAPGKYVRFRSPEDIIEEITDLHTLFPAQTRIWFEVESIALEKAWLLEFCKQLKVFNAAIGNTISYGSNFRISPQTKDEKIFQALKEANFSRIHIGLESGNPRVRREVLKRDYSNQDFLDVTDMARKAGIHYAIYNMIGLPGETFDDYKETVSMNRQCQPNMIYTDIFFPYPGTKLYDRCVQEGLIEKSIDAQLERRRAVIDFPQFPKEQIQKGHTWFSYHVYKGYKPLWWILKITLFIKIRSSFILRRMYRRVSRWPVYKYLQKMWDKYEEMAAGS